MRKITSHEVNSLNEVLEITVLDKPGSGGACHKYKIGQVAETQRETDPLAWQPQTIFFQNGLLAEAGVNGVTHESLLAIIADRLECFQAGPYACQENADALFAVQAAMGALKRRTHARMVRGVEGTREK